MTHPYASKAYVKTLAEGRDIVQLTGLGTWAIIDPIPATTHLDAAGPYPFTPLRQPSSYENEMEKLRDCGVVSFVAVTDALQQDSDWLSGVFTIARPYKTHYIIDRNAGPVRFSKHHQYEVRKAAAQCETKVISLKDHLDEWCALYDNLIKRHKLRGVHRFSRPYFEALADMPEFLTNAAFANGRMVSCHIWLTHGRCAYSHLAASSEEGYRLGAAYAVYQHAISFFKDCSKIDLGGVADDGKSAGLAEFKSGFVNHTARNWICCSIIDEDAYSALCRDAGVDLNSDKYYPAYRGRSK